MTTMALSFRHTVLQRKAVVYVRQSTPQQVQSNLESQRRQYELVDVARRRGFTNVEIIDDDLGRSASGAVDRPGFNRLVAALCAGQVGAVLCLDASRLARNGRDWHHLLELCGLVDARVIDLDGVYDPCRPNDRLLLGMKGSISEFELGIIRSRMYDAVRSKARRGELRISIPIGYTWDRHVGLGLDPDERLAEHPLSLPVEWQDVDVVRMAVDQVSQLSQCHLDSQKPVLFWRLRLWEEREADLYRRWPRAQDLWPPQAAA
jgi:DNA invertase Pin-like site-specific DNA recombinase